MGLFIQEEKLAESQLEGCVEADLGQLLVYWLSPHPGSPPYLLVCVCVSENQLPHILRHFLLPINIIEEHIQVISRILEDWDHNEVPSA